MQKIVKISSNNFYTIPTELCPVTNSESEIPHYLGKSVTLLVECLGFPLHKAFILF